MKKLFKVIIGLLITGLVLIVAAVVILPIVVSPNEYKPQIIQAVKKHTGRDLVIEGDIGMSVFPKIGLNLGRTSLSNAEGFENKAFASVEAVDIQVALMPLLDKKVEMDEVVLQGLSLNLQRNKAGKSNWDDLAVQPASEKKPKSAEQPKIESLIIRGVRIEDANIAWRDDKLGKRYEIKSFNLITGALSENEPVEIDLQTTFVSTAPKVAGELQVAAVVKADVAGGLYELTGFGLTLDAKGNALPGDKIKLSATASKLLLNMKEQTLVLDDLGLQALGVAVKGGLKGKAILSDQAQFGGKLTIAEFNARELIKMLGKPEPKMADAAALTRVSAEFNLAATKSSARLADFNAKLDETSLKGVIAVTDFDQQAITFDLTVDQINMDRYLPADEQQAGKTGADVSQGTGKSEAELFPLDTLRNLNANGTLRIGKLKKLNLTVTDAVVKVKANKGEVNVKPSANLYNGKYDADVTIDARKKTPLLRVNANLSGIQVEPLLRDLTGKAKLAGTSNAVVNITSLGNTQSAVKRTLNGTARFSFTDGALVGVNIAKLIRDGLAKFNGQAASSTNEPEKTDFSSLKGSAVIKNGVVNNQDFNMLSPLLRVQGAGQADLVKENLDYLLKASIVGSLQGQGGQDLSQLKNVTIPVRVTGPFSNPSYKPDIGAAISGTVKKKVEEKVEEKKEEVKEKLKDKLRDKLKGLF